MALIDESILNELKKKLEEKAKESSETKYRNKFKMLDYNIRLRNEIIFNKLKQSEEMDQQTTENIMAMAREEHDKNLLEKEKLLGPKMFMV